MQLLITKIPRRRNVSCLRHLRRSVIFHELRDSSMDVLWLVSVPSPWWHLNEFLAKIISFDGMPLRSFVDKTITSGPMHQENLKRLQLQRGALEEVTPLCSVNFTRRALPASLATLSRLEIPNCHRPCVRSFTISSIEKTGEEIKKQERNRTEERRWVPCETHARWQRSRLVKSTSAKSVPREAPFPAGRCIPPHPSEKGQGFSIRRRRSLLCDSQLEGCGYAKKNRRDAKIALT